MSIKSNDAMTRRDRVGRLYDPGVEVVIGSPRSTMRENRKDPKGTSRRGHAYTKFHLKAPLTSLYMPCAPDPHKGSYKPRRETWILCAWNRPRDRPPLVTQKSPLFFNVTTATQFYALAFGNFA